MSLFDEASLIVTPNAFKASKLYSIKPTDGSGDLSVTRATTATDVNSAGLIETVSANVPRLDYTNSTCPSILVEPQSTNFWTNNNSTTGYTTNTNAIKGNEVLNAFGNGVNGYEYTFNSTGQEFISSLYSIRVFDTRTFPVNRFCLFIKNPSSDIFNILFSNIAQVSFKFSNLTTNSVDGSIVKISNDTYALYIHRDTAPTGQFSQVRCSFVSTFITSIPVPISGTAILGLGFWNRSTGAILPNTTSAIITTTSAVTRNADVISKTGISSLIRQTEGTIYWEGNLNVNTNERRLLTISNGTETQRIFVWTLGTTLYTTFNSISVNLGNFPIGTAKIAIGYTISGGNTTYSIKVNNNALITGTAAAAPNPLSAINLGSSATGVLILTDRVNLTTIWKTRLSNTELATLTTL